MRDKVEMGRSRFQYTRSSVTSSWTSAESSAYSDPLKYYPPISSSSESSSVDTRSDRLTMSTPSSEQSSSLLSDPSLSRTADPTYARPILTDPFFDPFPPMYDHPTLGPCKVGTIHCKSLHHFHQTYSRTALTEDSSPRRCFDSRIDSSQTPKSEVGSALQYPPRFRRFRTWCSLPATPRPLQATNRFPFSHRATCQQPDRSPPCPQALVPSSWYVVVGLRERVPEAGKFFPLLLL